MHSVCLIFLVGLGVSVAYYPRKYEGNYDDLENISVQDGAELLDKKHKSTTSTTTTTEEPSSTPTEETTTETEIPTTEDEEEKETDETTSATTTEAAERKKTTTEATTTTTEPTSTTTTGTSTTTTVSTTAPMPKPRCFDQFPRCRNVQHLCKNELYNKIMKLSCAKTCGFCREFVRLPAQERCADTHPAECSVWGDNGFCHAYFYTMPEKIEHCMKTCGLC